MAFQPPRLCYSLCTIPPTGASIMDKMDQAIETMRKAVAERKGKNAIDKAYEAPPFDEK